MTSPRGPDPYAIAEAGLARLAGDPAAPPGALCRLLHEAVPTYTWVAVLKRGGAGASWVAQAGAPRRAPALAAACAAPLLAGPIVVADVAGTPEYRACFPDARALIALPIAPGAALVVASEHRGAFGLADRALLAAATRQLTPPDAE